MKNRKLILIELNEINFDIVKDYTDHNSFIFKNINKLLELKNTFSSSEDAYSLIEPWIQWASVHTGKTYEEHGVFRLGDIVNSNSPQLFEEIELRGYRVGAISPMNAENRLKSPSYFIADPWTSTNSSKGRFLKSIQEAVSQSVNDNSKGRITLKSLFVILFAFIRYSKFKNLSTYCSLAIKSLGKPWRKALFLDLLLSDLHTSLFKSTKTDFSTIFFNAGAHIQHHYLFNSSVLKDKEGHASKNPPWYIDEDLDPFHEMLKVYDIILGDHFKTAGDKVEMIVATGLSQIPYDSIKYYYRLKDHDQFLSIINCVYTFVEPRMTRDFLVSFDSSLDAINAQSLLEGLYINETPMFNEIDNRGESIFVTLTYPFEILKGDKLKLAGNVVAEASDYTVFVAIKNGMHQSKGYNFFTSKLTATDNNAHVKNIYNTIKDYLV